MNNTSKVNLRVLVRETTTTEIIIQISEKDYNDLHKQTGGHLDEHDNQPNLKEYVFGHSVFMHNKRKIIHRGYEKNDTHITILDVIDLDTKKSLIYDQDE